MVSHSAWSRCDTPLCCLEQFSRNFLPVKLDGSSATQAVPTKLKNSLRKCSQVPFLHLHRNRNDILNSLWKQIAPALDCKPGNATYTISGNCNHAEEGVTTPNVISSDNNSTENASSASVNSLFPLQSSRTAVPRQFPLTGRGGPRGLTALHKPTRRSAWNAGSSDLSFTSSTSVRDSVFYFISRESGFRLQGQNKWSRWGDFKFVFGAKSGSKLGISVGYMALEQKLNKDFWLF